MVTAQLTTVPIEVITLYSLSIYVLQWDLRTSMLLDAQIMAQLTFSHRYISAQWAQRPEAVIFVLPQTMGPSRVPPRNCGARDKVLACTRAYLAFGRHCDRIPAIEDHVSIYACLSAIPRRCTNHQPYAIWPNTRPRSWPV